MAVIARIKLRRVALPARPIDRQPAVSNMPFAKKDPEQGDWVPASGGAETPFLTRTNRRLLYCWQPTTGRHAYLDLDTDLILSDEEAKTALGM